MSFLLSKVDCANLSVGLRAFRWQAGKMSSFRVESLAPSLMPSHNSTMCAESLFWTYKSRLGYRCKPFATVKVAWLWTTQFVRRYNHQHKHSRVKFNTQAQRHDGKALVTFAQPKRVAAATNKWPRLNTGQGVAWNWALKNEVWLNPERNHPEIMKKTVWGNAIVDLTASTIRIGILTRRIK